MAGGGITSLQNRPGYFLGGVGDFFGGIKDKIVDDLIPNEIKDSPVGTALVGGALLNQFGIPFTGTPGDRMGQNWLGDLLGNISPNLSDMVIGPGGSEYSTTRPSGMDVGYSLDDLISGGGIGGAVNQGTGMDRIMDIAMNRTPYGQSIAGFQDARPTWQKALDVVQNVVTGGPDTTPDASGRYPIRWKEPLAIGTAIGAADYLTRSDDKMPEQLSIDPSRFATAEAAKADPLLRFKPQEQYTLKEGGRIGYDNGGITKLASHEGNDAFLEQRYEHYLEQGFSPRKAAEQAQKDLMEGNYQDLAQGGRIGYDMGKLVDPKIPDTETIIKNLEEFLKKRKDYEDRIMRAPKQEAAQGGRIGYAEGKSYEAWLNYRIKEIAKGRLPIPFKEWQKGDIKMASGGLAYMLGEPTYSIGGSVGHAPWHKPTGQQQPPAPMDTPTPNVTGTPDPLKAPRGIPSVAPRNMDPAYMQQQMMQQAMMGRGQGNTGQGPRPMANAGGRIGFEEGHKVPEEFLEHLKRKNLHKLLEEHRRWKEDYERRKDLAPTQEAAEGGRIGFDKGGYWSKLKKKYKGSTLQAMLDNPQLMAAELGHEGVFSLLQMLGMKEGGRAGFDKGKKVDLSKRRFLKGTGATLGVLSALPFVGKFFKAAKTAAPAAEKIATVAGGIPEYASRLIEVVKNKGIMEIIEGLYKRNPPSKKYTYKGVEVTEDGLGTTSVRKEQTKTGSWTDQASDKTIVDDYVDREIGFEIRKGETVTNKKGKQIQTPDEYTESTAKMQGDPEGGMDVSEVLEYIDEADHLELKKIADESLIKKASGGRASYTKGGLAHVLGV